MLKERAAAFRADPEVQEALAAARVPELSTPTLGVGETYDDLLADRASFEDFDPAPYFNGKGFGFVRLQQLATEHLLGALTRSNLGTGSRRNAARMTLVAGVDSSTQSCKVVIRDVETGAVARTGRAAHPEGTEVDPNLWWDALLAALSDAGGLDDIAAISIGGQQHGMVVLDAAGEVIRPALLWNDTRSAQAASDLIAEVGAS